ncbi:hypothetical protein, partial [Citrobacter amalonaticus]|uniref:hypothetical protein n=1 Tax=Citrobacter amalonaticus TaxID=35703 RepID=UPI00207D1A5A
SLITIPSWAIFSTAGESIPVWPVVKRYRKDHSSMRIYVAEYLPFDTTLIIPTSFFSIWGHSSAE